MTRNVSVYFHTALAVLYTHLRFQLNDVSFGRYSTHHST